MKDLLEKEKFSCSQVIEKAYKKGREDAIDDFMKFAYALGIDFSSGDIREKLEMIKYKFALDQEKEYQREVWK